MRNSLSLATEGLLNSNKRTLVIAVKGYLNYEDVILPPIFVPEEPKPLISTRRKHKHFSLDKRIREDEELLLILNMFLYVRDKGTHRIN